MTSESAAVTLHRLHQMRREGDKIAMLTCYDAAFARLLNRRRQAGPHSIDRQSRTETDCSHCAEVGITQD
jgi:hypothetical protein